MSSTIQQPPPSDPSTAAEWIEFYYAQGWSDGLPLVPPTEASVSAMLAAGGVSAEDILGAIAECNAIIPAEKVAINAVMAGCLSTYFPVVLAAVQALCHPDFHYHNPATSTGGSGGNRTCGTPAPRDLTFSSERVRMLPAGIVPAGFALPASGPRRSSISAPIRRATATRSGRPRSRSRPATVA